MKAFFNLLPYNVLMVSVTTWLQDFEHFLETTNGTINSIVALLIGISTVIVNVQKFINEKNEQKK